MADRMTDTTTDAAEARAFPRETIARLCLSHMYGFEFTGESLCDEADRIFSEPNPRAVRAVRLADEIADLLATAEAASGAGEREAAFAECASIAERWRDENKAAAAKARKSARARGDNGMADQLEGAAIECNAIAQEIRRVASLPPATDPAMVTVPREATALMIQAGIVAHEECVEDGFGDNAMRDAWNAMLAAAPTIPATGEAVPEGMKPWHGGDGPPDDWDGGKVYYANGQTARPLDHADWQRPADIPLTAYTPKATIPATGHAATEGEA